jgi:hypothetical protein
MSPASQLAVPPVHPLQGGTSIEDLAEKYPDKIVKIPIDIREGITDAQAMQVPSNDSTFVALRLSAACCLPVACLFAAQEPSSVTGSCPVSLRAALCNRCFANAARL